MSFNFKKKYGQNFLTDNNIINNIVDSVNINSDDLVIEIGPGAGALTKRIKNKDSYLIAYEIDKDVSVYLSSLENDKVNIIYDDFLERNIKDDIKNIKYNRLILMGNLPYYITTPIITKIIDEHLDIDNMVFMVQKEVAKRFSSHVGTKEYGSITVFLNYFFDIEYLFDVSRYKFNPVPNVDSAVIKFTKKNRIDVDFDKFNKLVKDSFQFKRKNLRNNLKSYDLDKINNILSKYNLSLNNRAEDLSLEVFIDIANNC